jgi:hypothetical protein
MAPEAAEEEADPASMAYAPRVAARAFMARAEVTLEEEDLDHRPGGTARKASSF